MVLSSLLSDDENQGQKFAPRKPVLPGAYLWWMADEVIRTVRSDVPFEDWLRAQEWGELMTRGEKERLGSFKRSVGSV